MAARRRGEHQADELEQRSDAGPKLPEGDVEPPDREQHHAQYRDGPAYPRNSLWPRLCQQRAVLCQ
jgi:hypothetical protein